MGLNTEDTQWGKFVTDVKPDDVDEKYKNLGGVSRTQLLQDKDLKRNFLTAKPTEPAGTGDKWKPYRDAYAVFAEEAARLHQELVDLLYPREGSELESYFVFLHVMEKPIEGLPETGRVLQLKATEESFLCSHLPDKSIRSGPVCLNETDIPSQ